MTGEPASAFAAMQSIQAGEWDRFLIRLQAAIRERMKQPEWAHHIVAGGGQ